MTILSKIDDVIHFYRVENLENVKTFYGGILNLKLYKDQKKCLIYTVPGYGKIGFCTHHPKSKNPNTCITFVYPNQEDVDFAYSQLPQSVFVLAPPKYNPAFNIYHFYVRDFEGITLEFQAFLKNE